MKKFLFVLIVCTLSSVEVCAQGIKTSFSEKVVLSYYVEYRLKQHTFYAGESVTIHAFKKKNGRYHFIVETEYYATSFNCNNIPFYATEKELKKLPDALGDEADALLRRSRQAVEYRINQYCKRQALSGKISETIYSPEKFELVSGTNYKLKRNDTVYVVGRKLASSDDYYAMYGKKFAGIYKTPSTYKFVYCDIDIKRLPSIDDPDVQRLIADKQRGIEQRKANAKVEYRIKALNGEIKGIMSGFAPDPIGDLRARYLKGDTVRIIGYSNIGEEHYFALYSDALVGTFKHSREPQYTFKNSDDIEFELLPAYDDPEVVSFIQKKAAIVDSLNEIKRLESLKGLNEFITGRITTYKKNSPFIISDISWTANSVGGIEVSLNITNCTGQTIKYVTFQGYFINAVGDRCRNDISGSTTWKAKGVGPIGPCPTTADNYYDRKNNCGARYSFDDLTFYTRVAHTFRLSSVTVEYTNGRKVTLSGANLNKHVRY